MQALPEAETGYVATKWMGTAMDEAPFLAEEMRRLHDAGAAWSDMAVLFRKNKDIEVVRATLEDFGIPVEVANLGGLLAIPEVSDLHAWLRILNDPEDAPATLRILMGSRYRLGLADSSLSADWARPARDEHERSRDARAEPGRGRRSSRHHSRRRDTRRPGPVGARRFPERPTAGSSPTRRG